MLDAVVQAAGVQVRPQQRGAGELQAPQPAAADVGVLVRPQLAAAVRVHLQLGAAALVRAVQVQVQAEQVQVEQVQAEQGRAELERLQLAAAVQVQVEQVRARALTAPNPVGWSGRAMGTATSR